MARAAPPSGRVVEVIGSALTALLAFAAVPTVLAVVVGNPLGGGLGHQWNHSARLAMGVLALLAWLAWLACAVGLARSVARQVRRGEAAATRTVGSGSVVERVAARIAIGILAVTSFGPPLAFGISEAGALAPAVVTTPTTRPAPLAPAPGTPRGPVAPVPVNAVSYMVRPGDSLWSIAETRLGDGADWRAIATLNLGRTMNDGRRFIDPSVIHAGWALALPPGAAMATVADVVTAPAPTPGASDPVPPAAPVVTPIPVTPTGSPVLRGDHTGLATSGGRHEPVRRQRPSDLPELAALGLGAVACAALARRSRVRRLLAERAATWPERPAEPSSEAVDADSLLLRYQGVPVLETVERLNYLLAGSSAEAVDALCVTARGVDVWLPAGAPSPPPPFEPGDDLQVWHVPHAALEGAAGHEPGFPVLLPVGDDAEGSWLVPRRAGTCLPLLGPGALGWWRAARRVQQSWAWSDLVVLTDDPTVASREAEALAGSNDHRPGDGRAIVFFGDPADMPSHVLPFVCVVTTAPVEASDLSIVIDRRGASIHPLSRTVQPNLVGSGAAEVLDELISDLVHTESAPSTDESTAMADGGDAMAAPGLVEVRLLTMTPRLDGLSEPLPPNRERRAIELVAYLALHRPDAVTSDRLRTRVLGSADADAAAKTLFNTATAARRAMGADGEGRPLLPPGTRTGQYSVSDGVTVDVQRAIALAQAGSSTDDPQIAMAYLRASLELVESEPLANALAGYTWWEAEGHGGRIAAVLVNAACTLATLALDAGLFVLAHWGLEQARMVDPYSEALTRSAMEVAAAEGDADRLRREWRECQRRTDELDPGSSPSPRTEKLYGALTARVAS